MNDQGEHTAASRPVSAPPKPRDVHNGGEPHAPRDAEPGPECFEHITSTTPDGRCTSSGYNLKALWRGLMHERVIDADGVVLSGGRCRRCRGVFDGPPEKRCPHCRGRKTVVPRLSCTRCGYDLATQPLHAKCSECGFESVRSAHGWFGWLTPRSWRNRVALSAAPVCAGYAGIAFLLMLVFIMFIREVILDKWDHGWLSDFLRDYAGWIFYGSGVLIALGSIVLAAPWPDALPTRGKNVFRRFVIGCWLVFLITSVPGVLMLWHDVDPPDIDEGALWLALAAVYALNFLAMALGAGLGLVITPMYARWLARRLSIRVAPKLFLIAFLGPPAMLLLTFALSILFDSLQWRVDSEVLVTIGTALGVLMFLAGFMILGCSVGGYLLFARGVRSIAPPTGNAEVRG